jgi:hypothetical protein
MPDDDRTPTTVRLTLTIGRSPLPWNVRLRAALKLLLRRHALLCTLVEFPADAPPPSDLPPPAPPVVR